MKKKQTMTREEAHALYDNLHKAMGNWMKQKQNGSSSQPVAPRQAAPSRVQTAASASVDPAELAAAIRQGLKQEKKVGGAGAAICLVLLVACSKLALAAAELSGLIQVDEAQATIQTQARQVAIADRHGISPEEKELLTALDARRVALEERARKLEQREADLERRDREFVTRLAEMRDLTGRLKIDRDKNQRQRNDQLTQLSKVYSSMNPTEAAPLIEQLDITIALALLERMSEKRVAQILALMNNERALMITKMLSGRD